MTVDGFRPAARRWLLVASLVAIASLVGVGCGDDAADTGTTETQPSTTTTGGGDAGDEQDPIEVELPQDFDIVVRTLRIKGTASVHEANLQWQVIRDVDDVLARGVITASCGAPCRGEFDEEINLVDEVPPGNYTLLLASDPPGSEGSGERSDAGTLSGGAFELQIPFTFYLQEPAEPPDIPDGTGSDEPFPPEPPDAPVS